MAISGISEAPNVDDASSYMLQYGRFEAVHKPQLEALGLPPHLWQVLYQKLTTDSFDIGSYVAFGDIEDDGATRGLAKHSLCLSVDRLEEACNVFLIDHAWTTTIDQVIENLDRVPGLLERMEELTGVFDSLASPSEMANMGALDSLVEVNVPAVVLMTGVTKERAQELLVSSKGYIIEATMAANDDANDTEPTTGSIQEQIIKQLGGGGGGGGEPDSSKSLQWRTRRYDCAQCSLDGGEQLDCMDVSIPLGPGASTGDAKCSFMPKHLSVAIRGVLVIDGDLYAEIKPDECTWSADNGMLNVTLTKRVAGYWPHLVAGEQHINPFALQKHLLRVSGELWRYFQGYDCMARGANQSVVRQTNWYIQDEVGLSVGHSDKPNVRCLPFLYLDARGQMTPFSVLWPIRSIALGEELTRDFCPSWLGDAKQRQGYLQSIFKAPTQAALNAYQELQQSLAQTARSATKANLPTTPMPVSPAKRVFVSEATPEIKEAIVAAGFETVESKEEADIVLDDTACAGKVTNQHPLNSIFGSTEKTVLALQSVAGAQDWLCPSFHLSTQICEFTGAVLMGQNSWWMLASDQGYSGQQLPRVVTNCWAAAVRHVDVGYTSAIKFMPPVVTSNQVHVAERLALLTPSNGLYTWRDNTWIYSHQIQLRDNKPEPFQTLMPAVEVDERLFIEQLRVRHGGEAFVGVVAKMDVAIVDLMSLMLGIGSSDSSAFGVFRFRFALEKNAGGIAPLLQEVRPVRVSELLASSQQLVPAILCALAETPDDKCWKQAGA